MSPVRSRLCPFDLTLAESQDLAIPARHRTERPKTPRKPVVYRIGRLARCPSVPSAPRPTDSTSPPARPSSPSTAGTSTSAEYGTPREPGRVSTGSSPNGSANGRRLPAPASGAGSDLTVNEMLVAYLAFADALLRQERQADDGAGEHPPGAPAAPPALRPHAGPGVRPAGRSRPSARR